MEFVYHIVPEKMKGDELVPLNDLKEISGTAWEQERKKYDDGREHLMTRKLPKLECLWNDVVHCTPLHPNYYHYHLLQEGFEPRRSLSFFQIPASRLGSPFALYHTAKVHWTTTSPPPEAVELTNPADYSELTQMPKENIEWYRWLKREGKTMRGIFNKVPHVLVPRPIYVGDLDVIDWEEPPAVNRDSIPNH